VLPARIVFSRFTTSPAVLKIPPPLPDPFLSLSATLLVTVALVSV